MLDAREFRDALGRFATGVTIVTTRDPAGAPIGVTANSYNSVSLDPPLVLWSLARTSRSIDAFQTAEAFAIHILASDQQALAGRFASRGEDKFAGLATTEGHGGIPILPACAAHFECQTTYRYEGGDHVIFVGRVVSFSKDDRRPLLFHQGRYTRVHTLDEGKLLEEGDGRYTSDFLTYLLSRSHMLVSHPTREFCESQDVSERHYATMGLLSMRGTASTADLAERLRHTGLVPDTALLDEMAIKGWVEPGANGCWSLTVAGRGVFISILSRARAREEDLLEGLDPDEVAVGKRFLRAVIARASVGHLPLTA